MIIKVEYDVIGKRIGVTFEGDSDAAKSAEEKKKHYVITYSDYHDDEWAVTADVAEDEAYEQWIIDIADAMSELATRIWWAISDPMGCISKEKEIV
jgi:hypothetical protein